MLFKPPYTFLTTKPQKRLLSKNHKEWLAILPIETIPTPVLKAVVTFTDASTESFNFNEPLINFLVGNQNGAFAVDEILTGQTSGATARILSYAYPVAQVELLTGVFETGEQVNNGSFSELLHSQTDIFRLRASEVKCFDMSYGIRDYDNLNAAKTIKSIKIRIESNSFDDQSAQDYIEYVPYIPKGDNIKALYYHNSYGGVDSIICTGDQQRSITTFGSLASKPLDLGYELGTQQITNSNAYHKSLQVVHTGNKPRLEIEALHDLFALKSAYEYKEISGVDNLIPIIPEASEMPFPSTKENISNLSFAYRYAFDERTKDRAGI